MALLSSIFTALLVTGDTISLPFAIVDPNHDVIEFASGPTINVNDISFFATITGLYFGMYYVVGLGVAKNMKKRRAA